MTLIGVGLGRLAGELLGDVAGYIGFAALVGVGIYMLVESARESASDSVSAALPIASLKDGVWGLRRTAALNVGSPPIASTVM